MTVNTIWSILCLFVIALVVLKYGIRKSYLPLPPGPPADPIIGHLRFMPENGQNLYFYNLGLKYGDVVHLSVFGKPLIILNSIQAASDLFDKQGAKYAGRPDFPIYDMLGLGDTLIVVKYGDEFRTQRRMAQNYFGKNQHKKHRSNQIREARVLCHNLIDKPGNRPNLLMRFSTSIIVEIIFGHQIQSDDDPFIEIVDECAQVAVESGPLGSTPVDLLPFLRYFPSWFPGTYYATFARKNRHKVMRLREYPLERVREQLAQGTAKPSFLASQLEQLRLEGAEDATNVKQLQALGSMLYLAGAETTSSTLSFLVLALVLHPECQIQAQKEIDSVIGFERLPEFEDRENLPYLECLMQEVLRWNQAVPSGGPRKVLEDDVYKGMWIPKGSTVIPNVRGMTLDENVYKDASKFDPTRFLPSPVGRGEPHPSVFGWGRRICPGRHLADDSVWIAMATILATLSISKAIGPDGVEITPDNTAIPIGITSHPTPYECRIEPRSQEKMNLLRHVVESV